MMSQNPPGGKKPANPVTPVGIRTASRTISSSRPAKPTPIPPMSPISDFIQDEKTDPGIAISKDFAQDEKTDPNIKLTQWDDIPSLNVPAAEVVEVAEIRPAQTVTKKMPDMGPLSSLMNDSTITEIMVNDVLTVMVERGGRIEAVASSDGKPFFSGEDEIQRVIRNILDATGKFISPEQPYVDATLPDGSRVNIVIAPVTLDGPSITIRKFPDKRLTVQDLLVVEALDKKMAFFLSACVKARLNILISGGTGSGKTTLLNVLTQFVPENERIVLIEDTSEVLLSRKNRVRLQTKPQTPSSPAITARHLVANALRMRPDRIIVGECRREEAFDMLQAMNTGHSGSMTTIHANTPRDALSRLESLCMMAGTDIPLTSMRRQMVSAIDLIVQIRRFRNGERKIVSVTEVTGLEGDVITLQDIFIFETPPQASQMAEEGVFRCTGFVPQFVDRLKDSGVDLPPDFFM